MGKPTLVVMAAGIGSRYGGLKQIDPVGPHGEIIIDYTLYDALKAGFGKIVFVIKEELEEIFREKIGKRIENRVETAYVRQTIHDLPPGFTVPIDRRKPWGTAHAVLSCRSVVDTPFAVVNADDFYGASAFRVLSEYLGCANDRDGVYQFCMVGFVLGNTVTEYGHVARGVCSVDADGYLAEIQERTRIKKFGELLKYTEDERDWFTIPAAAIVSMNAWGFTPGLFQELETDFPRFLERNRRNLLQAEYFLPDVIGNLLKDGKARVKVLPSQERWYGVTYQEDKPLVKEAINRFIRQGVYPENLWEVC